MSNEMSTEIPMEIVKSLSYEFKDPTLYRQALTHASWLNEFPLDPTPNYQRLEFLGDSVLKLIQATSLYQSQPQWKEGQLTEAKSKLENNLNLGRWSRQLGLDKFIRHGRCIVSNSESTQSNHIKAWNLICAQVFEAMLGAIWQDCNYNFKLIYDLYHSWNLIDYSEMQINYKKEVQEFAQNKKWKHPTYKVIESSGPNHKKQFRVICVIDEICQVSIGIGSSIKFAETNSAHHMYEYLLKHYPINS